PLGRDRQRGNGVPRDGPAGPQRPARVADRAPVDVRVLLGPAGLWRDVRLDRDARGPGDRSARVDRERPHTLRADVDREDELAGRGRHSAGPINTTGLIITRGSKRRATSGRAAIPSSPFSAATYGRWSRPTPCWWLI